ncbi:type VII toxin-antitoxin system HepT family RNase toxin [Halobacillus amylolyticus]|uniref:DUF86 domain-containing protein n=1 Tax=Halobacillus amylolyticus TaxID=2932259 RepID=A0ABY4HD48_9BACI|nr:DUF86 domain-containing protein [Halobacillus amylolyticus]UOR11820.1 DUF86 domain-containing protein [Halobacillus amylolyticus]
MYFVDRKKIEELLSYMETLISEQKEHAYRTFTDYLLLERMTHITVEIIIDVGNHMIDGFIMRDPGSYEDIIDILTDEKVLPKQEIEAYKAIIKLRKIVVQQYLTVDHEAIITIWDTHSKSFTQFPERIRRYLDEELGPVSAFSKE